MTDIVKEGNVERVDTITAGRNAAFDYLRSFGVLLVLSGTIGAVTTALTGNEWTWEWSVPFFLSIVAASQVYFVAFIKAVPNLKAWLARNGNR